MISDKKDNKIKHIRYEIYQILSVFSFDLSLQGRM